MLITTQWVKITLFQDTVTMTECICPICLTWWLEQAPEAYFLPVCPYTLRPTAPRHWCTQMRRKRYIYSTAGWYLRDKNYQLLRIYWLGFYSCWLSRVCFIVAENESIIMGKCLKLMARCWTFWRRGKRLLLSRSLRKSWRLIRVAWRNIRAQ